MPDRFPFRHRGKEVSRLEAFSDIVFGFALTLIVVSLEVPRSYAELLEAIRGFPAFALCFAILIWIWHAHYTFFRRYALQDGFTVVVNTALLFVVLFYIYPLKFIFASMGRASFGVPEGRLLFTIYGLGFVGIFALYAVLYQHAAGARHELELTPIELHDTMTHVFMYTGTAAIGVLSVILAWTLPDRFVGFAGWVYFSVSIVMGGVGTWRGATRRTLEQIAGQTNPGSAGSMNPE